MFNHECFAGLPQFQMASIFQSKNGRDLGGASPLSSAKRERIGRAFWKNAQQREDNREECGELREGRLSDMGIRHWNYGNTK